MTSHNVINSNIGDVKMKNYTKILVSLAFVGSLAACGHADDQGSNLAEDKKGQTVEAVLLLASAKATNGGINPDAFATEIKGSVQLGTNRCDASGKTAMLKAERIGKNIEVTALISGPEEAFAKICTAEYKPIFAPVQVVVRGMRSETDKVIVRHVGKMHNNVDVDRL